ncbi:hypothetical protein MRX96_003521 [Rhipicephalus microplus]
MLVHGKPHSSGLSPSSQPAFKERRATAEQLTLIVFTRDGFANESPRNGAAVTAWPLAFARSVEPSSRPRALPERLASQGRSLPVVFVPFIRAAVAQSTPLAFLCARDTTLRRKSGGQQSRTLVGSASRRGSSDRR